MKSIDDDTILTPTTPAEIALVASIKEMEKDQFLRNLRLHVETMIPKMPSGVAWPLKKICGNGYWKRLDKGEAIYAGEYVSFLVKADRLTLVFVKLVRNSRYYCRM